MNTTINIFPNTNIVVNGDVPYTFTSNDAGHLNHVEIKPKVSSESINVNLSGISFESVAIEDGTDLGEHTLQWIATSRTTQTWSTVQNRTLTCDDSIKDTYMTELRFLVSKGYNISGVQPAITGLSITTYPQLISQYGEFNLVASVVGPQGAVYDLQWEVHPSGDEDPYSYHGYSVSKTGALTASLTCRPNDIHFLDYQSLPEITVTDSISGLSATVHGREDIWPYAYISGPVSITSSGTYQYRGYKCVNDNVLGPQRKDMTGQREWSDFGYVYAVTFTLQSAPSGVTIDQNTGVLTVSDGIDSTFTVNANVITAVQDMGGMYVLIRDDASMSVTANTVTSQPVQSLEIYGLSSTIYTGTNSYPFKIYFSPSNADINSLVGNVVGVTPSDYSDMQYYIGTTKHTDAHGSYVDASITYTDLTKEGQLQVYVFDPNTGNRDDVYITSEAPLPASLTSLSIENVPIIETDPGTQRYSFRIYIDPSNGDLSNLVWDNYYTVMFRSSRSSFDTVVQFDGTRYYIDAWVEFENLSSTGQIGLVIKDGFNPSVYSEYVVEVIQ